MKYSILFFSTAVCLGSLYGIEKIYRNKVKKILSGKTINGNTLIKGTPSKDDCEKEHFICSEQSVIVVPEYRDYRYGMNYSGPNTRTIVENRLIPLTLSTEKITWGNEFTINTIIGPEIYNVTDKTSFYNPLSYEEKTQVLSKKGYNIHPEIWLSTLTGLSYDVQYFSVDEHDTIWLIVDNDRNIKYVSKSKYGNTIVENMYPEISFLKFTTVLSIAIGIWGFIR